MARFIFTITIACAFSYRRWGGTQLAYLTNGNVLIAKEKSGHKKIENTMKYIARTKWKINEDFAVGLKKGCGRSLKVSSNQKLKCPKRLFSDSLMKILTSAFVEKVKVHGEVIF